MRHRIVVVAVVAVVVALVAPWSAGASNDPYRSLQWGLDQVRAEQAWSTSDGTGVVVAVVDSGVDLDHPDLAGRLVPGTTTMCKGKVVTCGDGDWQSGDADAHSTHGTHVAGIVAAAANNGIGVAGTAPGAKVMPVKVLDEDGGSDSDIADGIVYAVNHGADVINMSLGAIPGYQALDVVWPELTDAVAWASKKGVLVVVAAGNDSFPLCASPGFTGGALCVTATDRREAPAYFTNGGINPELLSVAAPGGAGLPICYEDILSTVPVGHRASPGTDACTRYSGSKDYDEYAGTSMAAPHVAGVAALLAAKGYSRERIIDTLKATSRQPGANVRGVWSPTYGWGIVDAVAAVTH